MNEMIVRLAEFVMAISHCHADQFERIVKRAHQAGANREALLMAADFGRRLARVPESVLTQAHATIDAVLAAQQPSLSADDA